MEKLVKGITLAIVIGAAGVAGANRFPEEIVPPTPTVVDVHGVVHGTGLLPTPPAFKGLGEQHVTYADCDGLPDDFDLRDFGVVPETRDQGSCGSCWAFSETGSLESAMRAGGKSLDLSEQEIVSCDRDNGGCNGGNLQGFGYQIKHGQGLETDFPYRASDVRCKNIPVAAQGIDYAMVGQAGRSPTVRELQCALFKSHTIPWITVAAGGGNWNNPPSSDDGVFSQCGSGGTNHAVGVVGWKTIGSTVYFRMRNSWGTNWGSTGGRPGAQKGYALLTLGCDSFGDEVGYIITKAGPAPTPPHVKLPASVTMHKGDDVLLGIKAEQGVTYQWYQDGVPGAGLTESTVVVSPVADTVYKLVGKNSAGTTESSVKVIVTL